MDIYFGTPKIEIRSNNLGRREYIIFLYKEIGKVILVVLVVVLVVVVGGGKCEGQKKGYEKAANCEKFECPPYKVIYSEKEYEIRSYENATWMSTSPTNSITYKDAANKGFFTLLDYIQGKNSLAAKMDMTAPVLVDIYPSTEPSFVVNLYVPIKHQKNPPKSEQVQPVMLPKHQYAAVRRFGGFMDDSNIQTQALALKQSLKGTPWEYSSSSSPSDKQKMLSHSVAAYNSGFENNNRVNEVIMWFDK